MTQYFAFQESADTETNSLDDTDKTEKSSQFYNWLITSSTLPENVETAK